MFRFRSSTISGLALLCFASSIFAGVIRSDRSDSAYLSMGASSEYASVGRLDFTEGSSNCVGSGTLIAPDWVLTAAHCVQGAGNETFSIGGTTYKADAWVADPQWNAGNIGAGYDIGLVHLTAPVTGVAPAQRYTGSSELGNVATIVGYGKTGNGLTGAVTFDGKKRAGQNVIDTTYRGSAGRVMMIDFDNPTSKTAGRLDNSMGSSNALNLEYMIAPGDSGGGMFMELPTGPVLVGVTSFVAATDGSLNSDYGDMGGFTRVSDFNDWINGVIAEDQANLVKEAQMKSTSYLMQTVPEPGSLSLLALGALALLRHRRK